MAVSPYTILYCPTLEIARAVAALEKRPNIFPPESQWPRGLDANVRYQGYWFNSWCWPEGFVEEAVKAGATLKPQSDRATIVNQKGQNDFINAKYAEERAKGKSEYEAEQIALADLKAHEEGR